MDLIAAFRLFVRTLPIHFALLGRKRKYIKSKTTAKLKEKRTSIAAVRCRLPLKVQKPAEGLEVSIIVKIFEFYLARCDPVSLRRSDNCALQNL